MNEYEKSKLNRVKRGANRAIYDIEKINTILDAGFIGYIGYIYNDNAITIPMAYGRIDNKIYLHGSQANRMLLALLEAQQMSMTVMHLDALVLARSGFHHSVNYRSASLFGSVKKIVNPLGKETAIKSVVDHMMPGRWEGVRQMNKQEFDRTLVVEMTIETASAKVRDTDVADEPEDYNLPIWAGLVPIKQITETPISDSKLKQNIVVPDHVLKYYEDNKY
ncbi:pyridoxamine 5'-phosphate oxidase family protein [Tenacibaculum sp.]|nr:pyridoxamine 5'-phosphate oxidase family protein [Tenacibaculum sp.]